MNDTVLIVGVILGLANRLMLRKPSLAGDGSRFYRQLVMLALTIAGLIAIVIVLPIEPSTRNQIIGLVGLLLSGIIAFSSPTIFANLMAGLMLRATQSFRTGDYIRVGDQFGRVAERGLFDRVLTPDFDRAHYNHFHLAILKE